MNVELIGQIHSLVENKEERRELPMVLRHSGVDLNIKVRVRGNSRVRVCDFPPLRLNFSNSETGSAVFEGLDKLKLVTHCRNNSRGEINVLEEYVAYRIFNLISEAGYGVRLLRMTYTDVDGLLDRDARNRYGFIIEPADQLSQRVEGVQLHIPSVTLGQFNQPQVALVYVFQYLIGNTDWSFVHSENDADCCHNGDLFKIGKETYYIPYDFDLAGIVNAVYAKPDPSMRLRNVRGRRYRGFCTDADILLAAIRLVKSKREDIYNAVSATPGLTAKDVEYTIEYLAQFFKKAENEEKVQKSFRRQCIHPG